MHTRRLKPAETLSGIETVDPLRRREPDYCLKPAETLSGIETALIGSLSGIVGAPQTG